MLADIAGRPLLVRLFDRLSAVQGADTFVFATTCLPEEQQMVEALPAGPRVYRGAADDVVERMLGACQTFDIDFAVIVEGDELFSDARHVTQMLCRAREHTLDAIKVSNTPIGSWIVGVRRTALERLYAKRAYRTTEAWSTLLIDDPSFSSELMEPIPSVPSFSPELRLTIDYEEDLVLANAIYRRLEGTAVSVNEVVLLTQREPELLDINRALNTPYWERLKSRLASPAGGELA